MSEEEVNYTDAGGLKQGLWRTQYLNGAKEETCYKDDVRNGPWRTFYGTGELREEGAFVDGKQEGCFKFWYNNGELASENNYKNGELHGSTRCMYKNGKMNEYGEYRNNKRIGLWVEYNDPEPWMFKTRKYDNDGRLIMNGGWEQVGPHLGEKK